MFKQHDVECMSRALRLAKRGIFTTRPNPNVGCVIVSKQGVIIGEGFHHRAGDAHAEIHALHQAGSAAKDGSAYVTLEPCCHQGKTGPCTESLIQAGIKKVFIAMRDPNPLVSGKGIERLIQQGIEVEENILNDQSYQLNRGFYKRMRHNLPWVTAKIASSADGRTALHNGISKWITSEQARLDVQRMRARYDAILTGIGTVLADDPSLNVRLSAQELSIDEIMQPTRLILDPQLKMPANAKLLTLPGKTIIFSSKDTSNTSLANIDNCEVVAMETHDGKFDLNEVLMHIAKLEINSILLESGAILLGEMLKATLIDELIHYVAPVLMGNPSNGMFEINEITTMNGCSHLEFQDIRHIGKDIRITSLIKY